MLFVLSPAKKLDLSEETRFTQNHSFPAYLDQSEILVKKLAKMKAPALGKLMSISPQLSELNFQRFQEFSLPFLPENAKQAILCFNGDAYQSLETAEYEAEDFAYAQEHLRILSGLYGLLRPLDLIQPYRLEMGTKLSNRRGKNLYDFWGDRITTALNQALAEQASPYLINLASNEYFKSVQKNGFQGEIITPIFKDQRPDGQLKTLFLYAKQARGAMVNYAIREKVTQPGQLKDFQGMGYQYREELSDEKTWVFTR
jgi:hypothetical protein